MSLINAVIKQTNAYKEFDCDTYFRVYILCVHPSYQQKDIDAALLRTCFRVASNLNQPAIAGVFTSGHAQSLTLRLGFRLVSEIRYSRWVVNNEVVFDDPGKGNYSAAFMGMRIPADEDSHRNSEDVKQQS